MNPAEQEFFTDLGETHDTLLLELPSGALAVQNIVPESQVSA